VPAKLQLVSTAPDLAQLVRIVGSVVVTVLVVALGASPGIGKSTLCAGLSQWLSDASDKRPVRQLADPDLERGRGLLIVESLSTRWGTYPGQSGGKVVWAQLDP
jgi:hypothetical protein